MRKNLSLSNPQNAKKNKTKGLFFMLTFSNIRKSFGETVVFDGFSDEFEDNRVNCIFAPSGSGKTTLLNLAAGNLPLDGGEILDSPRSVSYVFQEERLIPQKTAYKNLEFILKEKYPDKVKLKNIINSFLESAGLTAAAALYPSEMSGGMKQRLSLIRAFAYPSEILLMDEPFKALDFSLKESVAEIFLKYFAADGRTTLFVTHEPDEAILIGDYIHIYSDKPMKLIKKLKIPGEKGKRQIRGKEFAEFKREIFV
jgi:NitT/TauT family transport system ATP-binding protein